MMKRAATMLVSLCAAGPVLAADPAGLDLTIEVLGREDRVDERIVNRIEVPGVTTERAALPVLDAAGNVIKAVGGVVGTIVEGVVAPRLPVLRYEEWVQQRHEAGRERDAR